MAQAGAGHLRWYQGLSRYQWWVLLIGVLSWMFDCMDQRLFVLSRMPAARELVGWPAQEKKLKPEIERAVAEEVAALVASGTLAPEERDSEAESRLRARLDEHYEKEFKQRADSFGDLVTALMVIGWSVGGFIFGVYGDRLGRVKTLSIAIAVYSVFTGLSGLASGRLDFCIWRFLMGCGIGGAFATAATLIAETMPEHARASCLGIFQALSAVGNITGSAIARFVVSPDLIVDLGGIFGLGGVSGWRILFMIGVLPAILVVLITQSIREPEAWTAAREKAAGNLERQLGDIASLFGRRRWRRNTFVGVLLAVVGVIGLWGVGFYSPELVREALKDVPPADRSDATAMGTLLQDVGALLGMLGFTYVATRMGRRLAFGIAFLLCWAVVSGVFLLLRTELHTYLMLPFVGFVTLSLFGGYSIYFPELYPTRLRSTGTGFCYNVGRVFAAIVILWRIPIRDALLRGTEATPAEVFRMLSVMLAGIYVLGLIVLVWAPETRGKPLPTDDDAEG